MVADLEVCRLEIEDCLERAHRRDTSIRCSARWAPEPELACRALTDEIRRCLDWHAQTWGALAAQLRDEGLRLDELVALIPREPSPLAEYQTVERLAAEVLPPLLATEADRRKQREVETWFQQLADSASATIDPNSAGRRLRLPDSRGGRGARCECLSAAALEYTQRLLTVKPLVAERDALLTRLRDVAPRWADRLQDRKAPHDKGQPPGDLEARVDLSPAHDTLVQRDRLDAQTLQYEADRMRDRLRPVTQELIDATAWGQQLARLQGNNSIRQALIGWLDTAKRLMSTRHPGAPADAAHRSAQAHEAFGRSGAGVDHADLHGRGNLRSARDALRPGDRRRGQPGGSQRAHSALHGAAGRHRRRSRAGDAAGRRQRADGAGEPAQVDAARFPERASVRCHVFHL